MRVISIKKLRLFWTSPHNPDSEPALRAWYQVVKAADWTCFADVRNTYNATDRVGNKVVFNIGGNKIRLVAVIDYESHKVFVRFVLDHEDYDRGHWKDDAFGQDWKPRSSQTTETPTPAKVKGRSARAAKPRDRKGRSKK
jgi:mRNA interferase HigB